MPGHRGRITVLADIALAGVALVAAACGGAGADVTATSFVPPSTRVLPTDPPTTTRPSTTTTTVAATTTTVFEPITIAFGGDVHGEPPIRGNLAEGENPFASVAPLLTAADLAIVNLETTVGDAGSPQAKEFVFRAPAQLLTAAVEAGVDVMSVANNHSWDYGLDGFVATLNNVRAAAIAPVGGGMTEAEAYAPAVFDIRGLRIAVLGIARSGPVQEGRSQGDRPGTTDGYDVERTVRAVADAAAQANVVIVMIHMGTELEQCPQADEKDLVARMLAAGATAVVGHHPHVLQGITHADGKLAAYSIGNFVFYASRPAARVTGVLTISIGADATVTGYTWDPARISDGAPILLDEPERSQAIADLAALSPGAGTCA